MFHFRCSVDDFTSFHCDLVFKEISLPLDVCAAFGDLEAILGVLGAELLEADLMLHVHLVLTLSEFFDHGAQLPILFEELTFR